MNNYGDKEYGIPEQKKFPLDTRAHVISAVKFFNYADPVYRKALASRIIRKIHQYNIILSPTPDNDFYKYYHPENSIAHHGILGQKWGVRRYQNSDGTLTAAGKKRIYGKDKDESYASMYNRAKESDIQTNLSKKYKEKASKAKTDKKRSKYEDLSNKAKVNSKIYAKGLTKDDKEFLRVKRKQDNITNKGLGIGAAVGATTGGIVGGILGGPVGAGFGAHVGVMGGLVASSITVSAKTSKTFEKELEKYGGTSMGDLNASYATNSSMSAAVRASNYGASLGMSGGTNPFMFG